MTPDHLSQAILRLYGEGRGGRTRLANELMVDHGTIMDWLSGKNQISGPAKAAISLLLELGSLSGSTMTATELKDAISQIYGDRPGARGRLAAELNVSSPTVSNWLKGQIEIPGPAKTAISLLLKFGSQYASTMTPDELQSAVSALFDDPSNARRQYWLARRLGVTQQTATRWLEGKSPIGGPALVAIKLLLRKKKMGLANDRGD